MPKLPSMGQILNLLMKSSVAVEHVSQEPALPEQEQKQEVSTSNTSNTQTETPTAKDRIRSIDDSLFVELIMSIWDPEKCNGLVCKVIDHNEGTYNYCVTVDLNDNQEQMVVRVPFKGTRETWTDDHAFEFRTEVMNQQYLKNKIRLRVPFVYEWDAGFDNILGAPFTIMPRIDGVSAYENLWFDHDMWQKLDDGTWTIQGAGSPSPELEGKRLRFLKDLANIMAKLQDHEFDKIGALHIEDRWNAPPPTVGHYFKHARDGVMIKTGPFSSTAEYLQAKKDEKYESDFDDVEDEEQMCQARAFARMHAIICDTLPRSVDKPVTDEAYESTPETFVLAHPDLDLQNIFVDEDGKITGIIDWSGLRTVPRWAGYSSLPLFLRKDFDEAYNCRLEDSPKYSLMPWQLESYRKAYHSYLAEALDPEETGNYNDAKWTLKSGATCAAVEALEFDYYRDATIQRLLKELPQLKGVFPRDFRVRLGMLQGWPEAENMLKDAFKSLFTHS
ncbi:hypothetical protein P171DRAFT_439460 [Karstenula rhodostoma CBS 690.94]|uniref:Aminoglycoside phosphotransferase domain-containing protein n=1 Tax=Karstenula rhodostoma CBS 690.94 TaxID=1392251 RepID=A0A9P4PX87_9PLEO|nr:hypothetical protein P171DRAFT_439460 [Karstenula rhodostoma CBS 690.94]